MKHHKERVEKLIREQLSAIMVRELEFGTAIVTITSIEADKKLETAKVNVGVWPQNEQSEVLKTLNQNKRQLQHLLIKKLNMKWVPALSFVIDTGLENAARVEKALIDEQKK